MDYLKLKAWTEAQKAAKAATELESKLRDEVFGEFFPTKPSEGTHTVELPHGWTLKASCKLNNKLDEAALPATLKTLREAKVNVDKLIKYKPAVVAAEFKKLTPESKQVFSAVLTQTPGKPTMELIAPKPQWYAHHESSCVFLSYEGFMSDDGLAVPITEQEKDELVAQGYTGA
jgi:hypothetical protein